MGWTDRDDRQSKCEGPLGAVDDNERVARLVGTQVPNVGYNPFMRREFVPGPNGFDDTCGNSDGASVDRLLNLSEADVRARSAAKADSVNGRRIAQGKTANMTPDGALVAEVEALRALRVADYPEQVVFVYDDPMDTNPQHAVIRVKPDLPATQLAGLIDDIRIAFSGKITQV